MIPVHRRPSLRLNQDRASRLVTFSERLGPTLRLRGRYAAGQQDDDGADRGAPPAVGVTRDGGRPGVADRCLRGRRSPTRRSHSPTRPLHSSCRKRRFRDRARRSHSRRSSAQCIGWCLMGVPFFSVVNIAASTYSVLDYRMRHGTLPLGAVAVLLQPSWAPGIVLFVFAVLLFPDGVRPSGLSRWAMWIVTAVGVVWIAGALGIAVTAIFQHNVRVDGGGNLLAIDHSTGAWAWWGVFQNAVSSSLRSQSSAVGCGPSAELPAFEW